MSAPIGPGDFIEAVGPAGGYNAEYDVAVGAVYQCEELVWGAKCGVCKSADHPGIHLVGKRRARDGFAGCNFRPIYRPSESLFLQRLMDVPASPELETA